MKLKQSVIIFCLFSTIAMAEPGTSNIPKPLFVQVQRLSDLLKDSHAEWYSESTLVQMISRKDGGELAFVVFNIVGFGGSNKDIQYFSIFKPDSDDSGKEKFMLIDVMPIGGKGWRYVQDLNAKVELSPKGGDATITMDALQVSGDDSPGFPSKKAVIHLLLTDNRLFERQAAK